MDVKSFIKIGLFSVGIPAMNIGSAFGWECSLGHEHEQDEMCTETGDRPCGACGKGFHRGWELCPKTVFEIPSENCKLILVPSNVQNAAVALLLTGCKYDQTSGKEIGHIDSFSSKKDAAEVKRLSHYVRKLKGKYLPKKAEDKKEGDGVKSEFLNKKRNAPEVKVKDKKEGGKAKKVEDKKEGGRSAKDMGDGKKFKGLTREQRLDRDLLWHIESGEAIKLEQRRNEKENGKKPYSDEEDEGTIKLKRLKKRK